jgi:Ca2+-binding RTX toxin-like protein
MARITGNNRNNELDGGRQDDVIRGRGGEDELDGNGGNDTLNGGAGDDELDGDGGSDRLSGGDGRDDLDGGNRADELRGGAGDDTLDGGAGNDLLVGGRGDDVFEFESRDGRDTIADFQAGSDRIRFDIDNLSFNDLTIRNNAQGDAVITWNDPDNARIVLDDVDASALSRNDFIFDN